MRVVLWSLMTAAVLTTSVRAHETLFAFVKEPTTPNKGEVEFEQWVDGEFGRDEGTYSKWVLREEIEYGVTDRFGAALYLNFVDEYWSGVEEDEGVDGFDFEGVSGELRYQLSDPYSSALGSLLYFEASTDGATHELEEKLVLGRQWDTWHVAFDVTVEQEWEDEDGETEEESALEFNAGIARILSKEWSVGLEAVHHRAYEGLSLDEEEYTATHAGPNVHFQRGPFAATFAVLPQVHGDGEGADGSLQLEESERVHTRLVVSYTF